MIGNIPAELRELPQWVVWRRESRDGKTTKIPYDAKTGQRASATDPKSWTTFDYAAGAAKFADGIGFVFTPDDPYVGVDFDNCVNGTRAPHDAVARIVAGLDSYTEVSPSGTGLHVIVRGELNGGRNRTSKTPWGAEFEIYDRGRYFCITGDVLEDKPIAQRDLSGLLAEMFPPAAPTPDPLPTGTLSDDDVLEKARRAKNADKFFRLWAGDASGYSSPSEADLALCSNLAFWTQDVDQIDRLFRRSALMREKWERADYREVTIAKALGGETYNGEKPRVESPPETDGDGYSLPFRRAKDVISTLGPEPDWIVTGLLEPGLMTVMSGGPFIGKSTLAFNIFALAESGGELLGLDVQEISYLLLTEEPARALQKKMFETGVDDFEVVSKRDVHPEVPWMTVARDAIRRCVEMGHRLLVVDTLPAWAGLTGNQENDPGPWYEALAPLRAAQEADVAVLLLHHDRKAGGRGAVAGRGSNALAAIADIWVQVARSGNTENDEERVLSTESRIDDPLKVSYTKVDGALVRTEGPRSTREKIQEMLGDEGSTAKDLAAALDITVEAVRQHLKNLEEAGKVFRTGAGSGANPFTFHRAGR